MHDRLVALTLDALTDQLGRAEREAGLWQRLAALDRQVARLDRIVSDVLEFARPRRVEPVSVDVAALLWDAAGAALGRGDEPHVQLALEPGLGTIVTDAERVRGVLANLVLNARDRVRAAGRAGGDVIELGGRRLDGGRLLLWVEDRGAGMAAADLPHAFEPLLTSERNGTELGLAIARQLIEALGGAIRILSREGEGTRVEIELPGFRLTPP